MGTAANLEAPAALPTGALTFALNRLMARRA